MFIRTSDELIDVNTELRINVCCRNRSWGANKYTFNNQGKRFYLRHFSDNLIQHIIITLAVLIFVIILIHFI